MSATTSKGSERVWFQPGLNPLFFTTAVQSAVTREGGDVDVDVDGGGGEGESDCDCAEVGGGDSDSEVEEVGALGIPTTVEEEVLLASASKEENVLTPSSLKGERAQSGTKIETST